MSDVESVPEVPAENAGESVVTPTADVAPAPIPAPAPVAAPAAVAVPAPVAAPVAVSTADESPKSRLVAILLCWFVGIFGVHRFYVGKVGTGIAMIFTLGGLGIWVLIDLIMIAAGSFRDIDGRPVTNWSPNNS